MARHKNMTVNLPDAVPKGGERVHQWDTIKAALLMDLRDEAQENLSVLRRISATLNRIDRRLAKHLPLKGTK